MGDPKNLKHLTFAAALVCAIPEQHMPEFSTRLSKESPWVYCSLDQNDVELLREATLTNIMQELVKTPPVLLLARKVATKLYEDMLKNTTEPTVETEPNVVKKKKQSNKKDL